MLDIIRGSSLLYPIVGDPIAQVKSPAGVSEELHLRGADALCVPFHVKPADFAAFGAASQLVRNIAGLIITIPHKFSAFHLCATTSPRATILGAVNVLRRNPDGTWHGDMLDGLAFVRAQIAAGAQPEGAKALLIGAGGAGSAIGMALIESGVSELVINDGDADRAEALRARLSAVTKDGSVQVRVGPADPSGVDMVCNATPAGMREGDPTPVPVSALNPSMSVGDVITAPEVTPLIQAARALGCRTSTGTGMFRIVQGLMVDFFLEPTAG